MLIREGPNAPFGAFGWATAGELLACLLWLIAVLRAGMPFGTTGAQPPICFGLLFAGLAFAGLVQVVQLKGRVIAGDDCLAVGTKEDVIFKGSFPAAGDNAAALFLIGNLTISNEATIPSRPPFPVGFIWLDIELTLLELVYLLFVETVP